MDKSKQIKIVVTIAVLTMFVAVFCFFESRDNTQANNKAKKKIEQNLLGKNNEIETSEGENLLNIPHEVYQKAKDSLTSFFQKKTTDSDTASKYILHENISTTVFWVGEKASDANHDISNFPSCWDEKWSTHFGGVDKSNKRNGYFPASFKPKENPFYIALPYNDFNSKGKRKSGLDVYIPWYTEKKWADNESVCKNRWVKIIKGEKIAFAQWEDAGPFGENDIDYVFGTSQPKSKTNNHAGLDVSPAVRDYLGLSGTDKASWQFVDAKDVSDGPWKEIITNSNIYWN
jgi:hypothetical protein